MNLKDLLHQAQEMQARLAREMDELRIEGNAGGGAVVVVLAGNKSIVDLRIDPAVVATGDVGLLRDMIVAAVNTAAAKVDETLSARVGGALPAGLGL